jgi:hypothetical protein
MDTTKFLAYLRAERDRIAVAIAALETLEGINADSAPALAAKPRRPKSRRTRHLRAVGCNGIRTRLQSPESETGTKWGKTGSSVLTFAEDSVIVPAVPRSYLYP